MFEISRTVYVYNNFIYIDIKITMSISIWRNEKKVINYWLIN